jgi:hypothetical protein
MGPGTDGVNAAGTPGSDAPGPPMARARCGTMGNLAARPRRQTSVVRDRAMTVAAGQQDGEGGPDAVGLEQLAQVLSEEDKAPGAISTDAAPILGEQLVSLSKEDADKDSHDTVQELQQKVKVVSDTLQARFEYQERRFKNQWCNLTFDEREIEEDFRQTTFNQQRKYMYFVSAVLMAYSIFAAVTFNVRTGHPPPPPFLLTLTLTLAFLRVRACVRACE